MDRKNIGEKYLVNRGGSVHKFTVVDIFTNISGETLVKLKNESVSSINIEKVVTVDELNDTSKYRKAADHKPVTAQVENPVKAPLRFDPPGTT